MRNNKENRVYEAIVFRGVAEEHCCVKDVKISTTGIGVQATCGDHAHRTSCGMFSMRKIVGA